LLLTQPNKIAVVLWLSGMLVIVSVIPLRHWSGLESTTLYGCVGLAIAMAVIRATLGPDLPHWTFNFDVALANLLATAAVAAGRAEHVHLANLYLLIMIFTVLFLPPGLGLAHFIVAGAGFAVVIHFGPPNGDLQFLEWSSVMGTAFVIGGVLQGLVNVLRSAALEDPLTGLANRRAWDDRLDEEVSRCRRFGGTVSVAMIDLDGFKQVNDSQGHDAGDELIRSLAAAWTAAVRGSGDVVARVGGDEFAVMGVGADAAGMFTLVARLRAATPDGIRWSVGAATWDRSESGQSLLRRADRLMYEAKQVAHANAHHLHIPLVRQPSED
jgi:diguanylate cyclase (GGDEF)-like protein